MPDSGDESNSNNESNSNENIKKLADTIKPANYASKALADALIPASYANKALADALIPATDQLKLFHETLKSISDNNAKMIHDVIKSISDNNAKVISDAIRNSIYPALKSFENIRVDPSYSPENIDKKEQIENLKKSYKEKKLVLVLGSGVSQDFGLPDWKDLSKKLLRKQIAESEQSNYLDEIAELLISYNSNFTVLVRNIYQNFKSNSNDQSFEEFVREVIYENCDDTKGYDLFDEIKNMMNNLDSIITYNFDDILDKYLEKYGSRKIKTIYDTRMQPINGELPIYHVHGILPKEGKLDSKSKITLSEDIYHQLYTDIYCWNNIIQINKFTDNTCLFIGTSLTDPSLRRLLDVAKGLREEKSLHFILKKREDEQKVTNEIKFIDKISEACEKDGDLDKQRRDIILKSCRQIFIDQVNRLIEEDAYSFGIETIMINDHNEIPTFLSQVRNS